jgi:type II secretory pathway predicted ATPase ExeA
MYKKYFGLRANPFNLNPDPRFLYESAGVQEALACLTYGVQSRKGFVMLTGEVGTGKTTLLNRLLRVLRAKSESTAYIFNPSLTVSEFLEYMLADFGIPCETKDKTAQLRKLNFFLLDRFVAGKTAVLIVDEAQNLSDEVLEEIRLLTNLETATSKLLQIILCGQPELEVRMRAPQLRQLRQRIAIRAKTRALNAEEVRAYIGVRLSIAGAATEIFSPAAIEAVHQYTAGIPRVINLVCEHALINGFADQICPINPAIIHTIAKELELDIVPPIARGHGENVSLVEALHSLAEERELMPEVDAPGTEETTA